MSKAKDLEKTYPLRVVARVTGLSPELVRAWETRYGVVEPMRTAGGTRRYRDVDIERLRHVKAAVDAGLRISVVAKMNQRELENAAGSPTDTSLTGLAPVIAALDRLDANETQRLLALQMTAMGPALFARNFVLPLVNEIGDRWARNRMEIVSEHLASSVLRSMLGSALTPTVASTLGPKIAFATPTGEQHEIGLLSAALTAMGAGANPIYLGSDLPTEQLLGAVKKTGAVVLALSLVSMTAAQVATSIKEVRLGLPGKIEVWVGGPATNGTPRIKGVERIATLEDLERRVALLGFEGTSNQ
jgi:DNA-binding transcriptional MerR regulator